MQSTTSKESKPARITALWFGVQLIWGAVLGISLQARYLQLTSGSSLELFGWISASGAGAAAITQLVVGPISDAMRRRGRGRGAFYAAGALLGAVAILAFYASSSLYGLLGSFVALQIALNVIIGPYQAIISRSDSAAALRRSVRVACGYGQRRQCVRRDSRDVARRYAAPWSRACGRTARIGFDHDTLSAGVSRSYRSAPQPHLLTNRTLVDLFVSRAFVYLGFYIDPLVSLFLRRVDLAARFALDATRTTGLCVLLFTVVESARGATGGTPGRS